jgi:aspartate/methionine/tyrosine aminotransferase
MPRFPEVSSSVEAMPAGVFSKVAHRIAAIEGERYPLHVGDTWLEPAAGCRMEEFSVEDHPGMHRYTAPKGHPDLVDAISSVRGVHPDRVIVTAGATGALGALSCALVSPGDEVLILSPFWPLIRGIVQLHHGVPVEVPVLGLESPEEVAAALQDKISARTVAVYVNTPNNPTGRLISRPVLEAIAELARENKLWIWSDEVYEGIVFSGEAISMGEVAPEQTFSVFSFSKTYGMAGNRCGYIVGPNAEVMRSVRKGTVHHFYSACTASQLAATAVLRGGADWLSQAVESYRRTGFAAADRLGVQRPDGGTFLFIDVGSHMDERGLHGFLIDCIDRGLILAPGSSCGTDYDHHVRVCFTSAPPDVVARGVEVLAGLIGR